MSLTLSQALNRALSAYEAGRLLEAEDICRRVLSVKDDQFDALHLLGVVQTALGQNELAVASFDRALAIEPGDADAHNNRGNALHELKRFGDALAAYNRALSLQPDYAEALNNRGVVLRELERHDEALASLDHALAVRPGYAEALNNRGNTLKDLRRHEEALADYACALVARPGYANVHYNRGNALHELKRHEEAILDYDCTLALQPNDARAHYNRGNALKALKRLDEALAGYDRALSLRPGYVEALNNRGNILKELNWYEAALESYDRALSIHPNHAETLNNRGVALHEMGQPDAALESYDRVLALQPNHAEALYNRGNVLKELGRYEEALASYDWALAAQPDHPYAFGGAADCAMRLCNWARRAEFDAAMAARISGGAIVSPFVLLGYSGDRALQLRCASRYIENKIPVAPRPLWDGAPWRHDKIRVAYLSADFQAHAMAYLLAELFELHDRARFEITGVSFGVDDGGGTRKRLIAAFDSFHDMRRHSDSDVAQFLHDREIDIAVDLMGYTRDSRPAILGYRPAPVQVNYLGYPGTMGARFVDYILADRIIAPFEDQSFFSERIVHLPDCYQVNDRKRPVAEATPGRVEMGLPEQGFVFCAFNNNWKIVGAVFDVWMRLLHGVEGSVLWLKWDNDSAERNLRAEAASRGVDPARLVFAKRLPLDAHLARHRLADIFVDTLPYNGHTTASDALWAGLPVVTCAGEAFAGRVASSLLRAAGLPELVAGNLADYEALALTLARDPALLAGIKAKLARNRDTCRLFDTPRFTRHIEAAYTVMWERAERGEAPESFSLPVID